MVSRQTDTEQTEVRVYKYGLVPIGFPTEEAISELWRANNLWNTLVDIHDKARNDYEEARCSAHLLYGEIAEKLTAINEKIDQAFDDRRTARMKAGTRDPSDPLIKDADAVIKALQAKRKAIYDELKPIRIEADTRVDKKALNDAFNKSVKAATQVKNNGLSSTTAVEVQANFKNAREKALKPKGGKLRFHRFNGTGYFAFRFRRKGANVDGVRFEEMFVGEEFNLNTSRFAFLRRDDTRKKTRLRLRATLVGGATKASKIFHAFDLIYHRPIPEGAQIQNGKIMRTRVGDKFKYHVVLTVKQPRLKPLSVPKHVAIGIDIGFRRTKDSVLVATITSSDPKQPTETILAPNKMIAGMEHVVELQSILDDAAAELGEITKPILKDHPLPDDHKRFGLWKAMARYKNNVTLSFETAYKVARWLQMEPDFIPAKAAKAVLEWWSAYSRRYRELHNLRAKQLLHRKHFYRQVAVDLVARKQLIVLEEINLTVFAQVKDKNNMLSDKARAQRFLASPSEFRDAIKNAANREGVPFISVPPQYTSKTCHSCGVVNKELASEKEWTCPSCSDVHDRDENAARNIAELGKTYFANSKKKKK
jgi:transposase